VHGAGTGASTPSTGVGAEVDSGVGIALLMGGSTLLFGARPLTELRRKKP
jgi:hypothetical protein